MTAVALVRCVARTPATIVMIMKNRYISLSKFTIKRTPYFNIGTPCLYHFRYLKSVVDETLRCCRLAPYAARVQSEDSILGGYRIPANVRISHKTYGLIFILFSIIISSFVNDFYCTSTLLGRCPWQLDSGMTFLVPMKWPWRILANWTIPGTPFTIMG